MVSYFSRIVFLPPVNPSFNIRKRPLTQQEARVIVRAIKRTSNITGYTVREWTNSKHLFVAENPKGEILGACLTLDFSKEWTEIAVLFVLKEHRRNGIGQALFLTSYIDTLKRKKNVLIMSKNKTVVSMMREVGLDIFSTLKNLPTPYRKHQLTLGLLYNIVWIANLYRIKEIIRKAIVYASKEPFVYGLKLTSSAEFAIAENHTSCGA